ncbi:MAG: PorV/PorQ family protein [Bacteroidales bacterium]|jgi:hypothetical protein|nr:PorV/PorQ family protein [Bacteroidales bacterium]
MVKAVNYQLKKRLLAISICLIISGLSLYGQTAKYSNAFLTLGVGAEGLSVANTMVAMSDDVTAAYWNPACLSIMRKKYELSLMHTEYFAGIAKYDYGAFGYRIDDQQTVALTILRFGVDNIPNTTQLIDKEGNINYDRITYFTAADWGILLSYGRSFTQVKGLSFGANFKIVERNIGKFANCWGFGLDAGLLYEIKKWKIGLVIKDLTTTFNAWTFHLTSEMEEVFRQTNNDIPQNGLEYTVPSLSFGAGKNFELGKGFTLEAAIDFDMFFDGERNDVISGKGVSFAPHAGLEFGIKNIVFVRAGIGNMQKEIHLTEDGAPKNAFNCDVNLGIGFCIKDIVSVDYALCNVGDVGKRKNNADNISFYSHVFSLKITLDRFKR